jgi:hypothetical protein
LAALSPVLKIIPVADDHKFQSAIRMCNRKSERVVEIARCLAALNGGASAKELARWFHNFFEANAAGPQWERFKVAYASALYEEPKLVEKHDEGLRLGFINLTFASGKGLKLIDMHFDLL